MTAQLPTHLEFRSNQFPTTDGDESVNPGVGGKMLANFLHDNLQAEGFETESPVAEDWGWVVPVVNKRFRMWIGCGRYPEYHNGFLCFIEPHEPFVRKFLKKIDTRERVSSLRCAMDKVLVENVGVTDKRWSTYDEFNCR